MVLELTDTQAAFLADVTAFAAAEVAPRAAAIDETGEFPADVMRAAAAQGLLGMTVPMAWGGLGLDYVSYSTAIEAIVASQRHGGRIHGRASLAGGGPAGACRTCPAEGRMAAPSRLG